jgi:hypothetical protein
VNDIDGSQVGTKNRINKFQSPFDYNLNVCDVPGAIAGSLKKGIVTERNTNPINPKYKYIGEQELGKFHINDPYANGLRKHTPTLELSKEELNTKETKDKQISRKQSEIAAKDQNNKEGGNYIKSNTPNIAIENNIEYNKDLFKKPNPNYSYIHDKFIIPAVDPSKKYMIKNNHSGSNNKITKDMQKTDFSRTDSQFVRKTNAQKLDSFILNKN